MPIQKITQQGITPATVAPGEAVRIDPQLTLPDGSFVAPTEVTSPRGLWLDTDSNPASTSFGTFRIQNITTEALALVWVATYDHSVQLRKSATIQNTLGPKGLQPAPPSITVDAPTGPPGRVELQSQAAGTSSFFDNLTDALAASLPGDLVLAQPFLYDEVVTVPSAVTLRGTGDTSSPVIAPSVPGGTRVTLERAANIENFLVFAPDDGTHAINAIGTSRASSIKNVAIRGLLGAGTSGAGVNCENGGKIIVEDLILGLGDLEYLIRCDGGAMLATNINPERGSISAALIRLENGAVGQLFNLASSSTASLMDGLSIGAATLIASGVNIENAVSAVHITENAATVRIKDFLFENNTLNVFVDPALTSGTLEMLGGALDASSLSIPVAYALAGGVRAQFLNAAMPDISMRQTVDLSVGNPLQGNSSYFGEGLGYTLGASFLRNTSGEAGTWSDITTELTSTGGSIASLFPGTGVGNTFYIGGFFPFFSFFMDTSTALVLGTGSYVCEFWQDNGGDPPAWVAIDTMATSALPPRVQLGNTPFEREAKENVYFGETPDWASKVLNGIGRYWLRFRLTAAISTIPAAEFSKLGPNRTEIGTDGFVSFYGGAQPLKELPVHNRLMEDADGAAAANQDVFISPNVDLNALDNEFNNGARDGRGINVVVPPGLDTSKPLTFRVRWKTNNAGLGDIDFDFWVSEAYTVGDVLNGTLGETALPQLVAAPGTANEVNETEFTFSIPMAVPGDAFGIVLLRDARAANPDDTYGGNVSFVSIQLTGKAWCL